MVKSSRAARPKFTTHADGSDAVLFLHELVGEQDGPTVGICGLDPRQREYRLASDPRLFRALKRLPLKGRILLLPVANPRAFAVNHRFTPIDELNLNREFPGDPQGNYTQQLAAAISARVSREDRRPLSTCTPAPTGRPSTTSTSGTTSRCRAPSDRRSSTARRREKTARVYSGTTKAVTLDRRRHPRCVRSSSAAASSTRRPMSSARVDGILNHAALCSGVIDGDAKAPPRQVVVHELAGIRPTRAAGWSRCARPMARPSRAARCWAASSAPILRDARGNPDAVRERHHDHAASDAQPRRVRRLRLHGRQSRRRGQ